MKKHRTLLQQHTYLLFGLAVGTVICWKFFASDHTSAAGTHTKPAPLPKPHFADLNKEDQTNVRADLLASLGISKEQNIEARAAAIKALPDDLSAAELDMLLRFLIEYRASTVAEGAHAFFFHELCNKLHHFSKIRPTYAAALYQVAGDDKHDPITRDYAIQHLRRVWEKSPGDLPLRQSLQASFWQLAAGEPATAASAMLSLHNLGIETSPNADYSQAAVPTADFQPFLDTILRQAPTATSIPQRLTAVRIAGDRRIASAVDLLVTIVENNAEHTLVRTSAINALRKLGMKEQLATLAAHHSTEPRLSTAFAYASR
jgi:hypothetical protein